MFASHYEVYIATEAILADGRISILPARLCCALRYCDPYPFPNVRNGEIKASGVKKLNKNDF